MVPDRHLVISPGETVATGYVDINKIRMANRVRMAVGDVETAFRRQLQLGPKQAFPPPNGEWEDDEHFVIHDGRHAYVSALMLGMEYLFVAWVVKNKN